MVSFVFQGRLLSPPPIHRYSKDFADKDRYRYDDTETETPPRSPHLPKPPKSPSEFYQYEFKNKGSSSGNNHSSDEWDRQTF